MKRRLTCTIGIEPPNKFCCWYVWWWYWADSSHTISHPLNRLVSFVLEPVFWIFSSLHISQWNRWCSISGRAPRRQPSGFGCLSLTYHEGHLGSLIPLHREGSAAVGCLPVSPYRPWRCSWHSVLALFPSRRISCQRTYRVRWRQASSKWRTLLGSGLLFPGRTGFWCC